MTAKESFRLNAEHAIKLDALLRLFSEKEQAAIRELAESSGLNEVQVVRQALRYFAAMKKKKKR